MTNPERPNAGEHTGDSDALTALCDTVASWYPEEEHPEFLYQLQDGKYAMLGIEDIAKICGSHIVVLPHEQLKSLLDNYHCMANRIHEKGEQYVNLTRNVGREVLIRYT